MTADERRAWSIAIPNWEKFQHADRKRNKEAVFPWIKLHRQLLNKTEWRRLHGSAAKLLVDLWMLAGETEDGQLTIRLEDLAYRVRVPDAEVAADLAVLQFFEFVQLSKPASDLLAEATQAPRREERRGEGEEKEIPRAPRVKQQRDPETTPEVVGNWVTEFGVAWAAHFLCPLDSVPWKRIGHALKPLRGLHPDSEILSRWERYLSRTGASFASAEKFAQTFGEWAPQQVKPDTRVTRDVAIRRALESLTSLDDKRIPRDGFPDDESFRAWLAREQARQDAA